MKYHVLNGRYARNSIRAPPRSQLLEGSRAAVAELEYAPGLDPGFCPFKSGRPQSIRFDDWLICEALALRPDNR